MKNQDEAETGAESKGMGKRHRVVVLQSRRASAATLADCLPIVKACLKLSVQCRFEGIEKITTYSYAVLPFSVGVYMERMVSTEL